MTSKEIKAALGSVRVRAFSPVYFRVCTLDGSAVDALLPRAEALGFRAYKNQSHEMFLHVPA
jgi:hypothetical protein